MIAQAGCSPVLVPRLLRQDGHLFALPAHTSFVMRPKNSSFKDADYGYGSFFVAPDNFAVA